MVDLVRTARGPAWARFQQAAEQRAVFVDLPVFTQVDRRSPSASSWRPLFFARFWRRTGDRLFIAFAIAFALLAIKALHFFYDKNAA